MSRHIRYASASSSSPSAVTCKSNIFRGKRDYPSNEFEYIYASASMRIYNGAGNTYHKRGSCLRIQTDSLHTVHPGSYTSSPGAPNTYYPPSPFHSSFFYLALALSCSPSLSRAHHIAPVPVPATHSGIKCTQDILHQRNRPPRHPSVSVPKIFNNILCKQTCHSH